ncbi:MAG: fatty acid desaturase [Nitratireductor sp.]
MNPAQQRDFDEAAPLRDGVQAGQTVTAKEWSHRLAPYRVANNGKALLEIAFTTIPLAGLWVAMWFALQIHVALAMLVAIPAGAFLVRLFMVQHDCGHGSFFSKQWMNDWAGRTISLLTLTPYGLWRRTHALHHAGSGCLDHRGHGDVDTLTVDEYEALPNSQKLRYRLYRHPLVLFGLGPAWLFLIQHRFPFGLMRKGWQPWASAMGTNLALLVMGVTMSWLIGPGTFLLLFLPVTLIAASIGVWLFFVQHQFEDTVWHAAGEWDRREAALHGSSHYDLPPVLRWMTANIGIHHVHHLASGIPYYSLGTVLNDYPELRDVSRLTLGESLSCINLALWDARLGKMVTFRQAAACV